MNDLIGKWIVQIRPMTQKEKEYEGWDFGTPLVIILDDGTKLYPSQDAEGNGPGELFGTKNGEGFALIATERSK